MSEATKYQTAYAEALAQAANEGEDTSTYLPSYMVAGDTLNAGNRNQSFLESAASVLEDTPQFIGASIISGVNSLYNAPAQIGNFFGGENEIADTYEVIAGIDSDLGTFYEENREGVDLVGFMASSLVPGIGGVKMLNAGQASLRGAIEAGSFGTNMGKALGLLAPTRQKHLAKAMEEIRNSNSAVSLLQGNAQKAVMAGFGQNILEAAAFETAVAASMFNSPILENQEWDDLLVNIAFGGLVFGAGAGVLEGVVTKFKLGNAAKASDIEARPWTFIPETPVAASEYETIALAFERLHDIPEVPTNLSPERQVFLKAAATATVTTLHQNIRKSMSNLANGDEAVAGALFDAFKRADKDIQLSAFIGLDETARMADLPRIEKTLGSLKKKINNGTATVDELDKFAGMTQSYTKTWGEGRGVVSAEQPVITSIIDTLKTGEKITWSRTGVTAGKTSYKFSDDYNFKKDNSKIAPWNIMASNPLEADARRIWASKLKPFAPTEKKPLRIHENDLPLLEKAMKELTKEQMQHTTVIMENSRWGRPVKFDMIDINFMGAKKEALAVRLQKATSEGLIGSDANVVAAKLRSLLGVQFGVVDHLPDHTRGQAVRDTIFSSEHGRTKIEINRKMLTTMPLHKLVSTILHEEGHIKFDTILDIGGIPSGDFAAVKSELIAASRIARKDSWDSAVEGTSYWSYLNETHELMADTFSYFTQNPAKMAADAPTFAKLYGHIVRPLPQESIDAFAVRSTMLNQNEIAAMVNVKSSFLDGKQVKDDFNKYAKEDIFAMQDHAETYTKRLVEEGKRLEEPVDIWNIPQNIKLTYDTSPFAGMDNNVVSQMDTIKSQQKIYMDGSDMASRGVLGEIWAQLPEINSKMIRDLANRGGAGAGFVTAASNNYGSLAATMEHIGNVTARAIEGAKTTARESLEPALYKVAQKQEAAIEWAVLNANIRAIPENFGLNAAGDAMEPIKLMRWREAAETATARGEKVPPRPKFDDPDMPERIEIKDKDVRSLARIHTEVNGSRTEGLTKLRAAQGVQLQRDAGTFYPIPVDPKDFPYFATVEDISVTSTGHTKMLYAKTEKELNEQMDKLRQNDQLKIRTKGDAEAHYKSVGQWDFEKSISDNYLDLTAKRNGVSSPFFVPTDVSKITGDTLNWHMQRETALVREAVSAKYEVPFAELETLGKSFTNAATSKFSNMSLLKFADDAVKNPYKDYVKTALGVKKNADYPVWTKVNNMADEAMSSMFNKVSAVVESARNDKELAHANLLLKQAGYKGAAYDESMEIFANATPDRGLLTNAIQKANSVLATVVLRWDALNAVNNAVSANVLLGAELKAVVRAIGRGDEEAVGALAKISEIKVPGTNETIFAPRKLIAQAMKNFEKDGAQLQWYKDNGFVTTIHSQYKTTLDELSYTGGDVAGWSKRVSETQQKLRAAADTGEKWTGNRLAEEFNRFVAADVMKQLTDVAVERGLMQPKEALAYINTFVNRTQGNYLASQRPMMFQGPIGQGIGLFQTYQFNLMQQLLRHVGEGHAKDSMTLLGLQGTIHGMNGLPGFNAINTNLIGNASGNQEHKDAYTATYGIAGKEGGDWLMYGMASNALGLIDPDLKINLYTRGDINPRHVTIVPTSPADVPIVQAYGKFFANLFATSQKMGKGGDPLTTFLQGVEHNGISRPLAGLAQTLQGVANPALASYSTSNRGNVIASNDMLTLANIGRMAGGKPMQEALAIDAVFRYKAYGARDNKKKQLLGQAIKTTMIAGLDPTTEQIEDFAAQYAKIGGKQKEFGQFMTQLARTANLSQSNKIQQSLTDPFSQSMQELMGGKLRDFTE